MASSPHVLVVDKSRTDRLLVSRFLKSLDIRVTSMGDPEEALEFLDTEDDVNLVLIDYHMTQMTGYDLLKKLKESPRLRHIPVVIVFTHYTPEELKRCLDAGAEDYIVKPITVADVPRILNHI
ncbi:hypothetical protein QOZ80_4BG0356340 [Eleusine coracana subsp. coracana]|nr:hypothetical protein QOZ80_4BG0356340 [Eleusine coracana subsp. coracana]